MSKESNLEAKEKEYIIGELLNILDSVKYGGGINLTPKKLKKYESDDFSIGHKEFELIKSITSKLSYKTGESK